MVLGTVALTAGGALTADAAPLTCWGLYPKMRGNLCPACLGRLLLGYASREQQTAAVKAAFEVAGR